MSVLSDVRHRRHLEVLDFAPQHRELALELPRSYREKAVARFKRMAINLRDPSDWEDGEIRERLISPARIYQKKAGYVRAHAERKRLEVWEADCRPGLLCKNQRFLLQRAGLDSADLGSAEVLDNKLDVDTIQDAVFRETLCVNRKLKRPINKGSRHEQKQGPVRQDGGA